MHLLIQLACFVSLVLTQSAVHARVEWIAWNSAALAEVRVTADDMLRFHGCEDRHLSTFMLTLLCHSRVLESPQRFSAS